MSRTVVEIVEGYLKDWDGIDLPDEAEPRIVPTVGQLRVLLNLIDYYRWEALQRPL